MILDDLALHKQNLSVLFRTGDGAVSIVVDGIECWRASSPVEVEYFDGVSIHTLTARYDHLSGAEGDTEHLAGTTRMVFGQGAVVVTDRWSIDGTVVRLERSAAVEGEGEGGFATSIRFTNCQTGTVRVFVPGMIYGGSDNLTASAIGGADTWNADRHFTVLIREDRMPGPVVGCFVPGGRHLALFDLAPTGEIPLEDSRSTGEGSLLVDGMRLNSLGFAGEEGDFAALFCTPAIEGEITYSGLTYPGGQLSGWRRRYQHLTPGAEVHFSLGIAISDETTFHDFARNSWRLLFARLDPQVKRRDLGPIIDALVRRLAAETRDIAGGGSGIPNFIELNTIPPLHPNHNNAIIGFTGKNLESANAMLRWADDHPGTEGDTVRSDAEAIVAKMIQIPVDPPAGEGFNMETGGLQLALPRVGVVFLRSFGDDVKVLVRAYAREASQGREHTEWLAWVERFGRWLITQQREDGSFPRAWEPGTGNVLVDSPYSTYNAIPLFTELWQVTGDKDYLDAAVAAGEWCWKSGHAEMRFIGGTIDNPNIIDKEAGTLSLEGYLALYAATKDPLWLEAARYAADFAETWIYIWNVPICPDEEEEMLHWKKGLPTIGMQLIASGHSLTDMYMAFDVDEYAMLYRLTGDEHYRDVAAILLHGTKTMISLSDAPFDFSGEGWQQEHWSLAPRRGQGLHRGWLPWVNTSHLAGYYDLKDKEPGVYEEIV